MSNSLLDGLPRFLEPGEPKAAANSRLLPQSPLERDRTSAQRARSSEKAVIAGVRDCLARISARC